MTVMKTLTNARFVFIEGTQIFMVDHLSFNPPRPVYVSSVNKQAMQSCNRCDRHFQ